MDSACAHIDLLGRKTPIRNARHQPVGLRSQTRDGRGAVDLDVVLEVVARSGAGLSFDLVEDPDHLTVRGALVRVDEGKFGACVLCKDPIPEQRLELAPETPFCIACQTKAERDGDSEDERQA